MVFPKPGLKYSYQFRLPDHVRRKKVYKSRDPTKIYELLSDDDLYDIRGVGLQKLDLEDMAQFDKEKKEAEEFNAKSSTNNNKNSFVKPVVKPASRKGRTSLMKEFNESKRPKQDTGNKNEQKVEETTEIQVEPNIRLNSSTSSKEKGKRENPKATKTKNRKTAAMENKKQSAIAEHSQKESVVDLMSYTSIQDDEKPSTSKEAIKADRGKERIDESQAGGTLTEVVSLSFYSIVSSESPSFRHYDSSKENETEGASDAPKLYLASDRNDDSSPPPVLSSFSDPIFKSWSSKSVEVPPTELRQEETSEDDSETPSTDRMNSGKVKLLLSSLHYIKKTWPINESPQKTVSKTKKKKSKSSDSRKPPTLLGPFTMAVEEQDQVSTAEKQEKLGKMSYNKKSPKDESILKVKSKKKGSKKPRKQKRLTLEQKRRRVRYAVEKHFANMPGMSYRCPNMQYRSFSFDYRNPNRGQIWICLVCQREELDDKGDVMICCDNCESWYHLRCVGVIDEIYPDDMNWYCKRCMNGAIRSTLFNPVNYPLYTSRLKCAK